MLSVMSAQQFALIVQYAGALQERSGQRDNQTARWVQEDVKWIRSACSFSTVNERVRSLVADPNTTHN